MNKQIPLVDEVQDLKSKDLKTMAEGDDLLISGFGKFSVRQKKARQGRNPQTKGALTLGPRKVLVFKASGVLRERMNKK